MTDDASPENLRKFLESDDPAMVRMGISLAKGAGVEVTVKDFERFLKSGDVEAIKMGFTFAEEAGVGVGDEAMRMLCKTLGGEAPSRRVVAEALGEIGDTRAVEQLINVIDYGNHERFEETVRQSDMFDWDVSIAAAEALGKIGDTSAVEPLINMLEAGASDRDRDRSGWPATIALGAIGDSRAIEPLLTELCNSCEEILEDVEDNDGLDYGGDIPEWYACQVVPKALIQIEDKKAIFQRGNFQPLIGLIQSQYDWWLPFLAAESLEGMGWKPETDEQKTDYLIASRDWEGCTQMGEPTVENAVIHLWSLRSLYFHDACREIADEIEWDLQTFGEAAVMPLIKALEDESHHWPGRTYAANALGELGDSRAIEPLIKALDDEDVCDYAKEALCKLGHEVE
jgi:HEAT repeat protein